MENALYHVVHEGRRLGPFDRRTIVGMRVRKALASADVLVGSDGARLTVADLVHQRLPAPVDTGLPPVRAASRSLVQAVHAATLLPVAGDALALPPFRGEVEVRVQTEVLRIAGRHRAGLGWRDDRVKLPLQDIAHARLRGTVVDLWVRTAESPAPRQVSLDLGNAESAGELAESLPHAAPWPGSEPLAGKTKRPGGGAHPLLWTAVVGTTLFVGAMLVWVFLHRA